MTLYEELEWRGLIKDISNPDLIDKLNKGGLTFYIGTDPTGDSLHIGHFSSFLISKRLKDAGHNPLLLIGGATGLIGDPKPTAERLMIEKATVQHNYECLKKQAEDIFGFTVVNNYDWIKDINVLDYLRDYGKYFNINYMLDKDIIRRRLDEGITYTEFSYMLLQALDFLHLYEENSCTLQVAGSDQWGNITAGIDLIRKKHQQEVYAFTMPLLTKSDGTKFGKSEGNAIWLDKNKTTPYELYQFLINSEDSKVIDYLKFLTFLSVAEIKELEEQTLKEPEKRFAHTALAKEVITFLHGKEAYLEALKISKCLFDGNIKELTKKELEEAFKGIPTYNLETDVNIVDFLNDSNIVNSKRIARELLTTNSISINGDIVSDTEYILSSTKTIQDEYIILRKGKKKYYMLKFSKQK